MVNLPISEMIVGTKSGREAKPTLTEKYIIAGRYAAGCVSDYGTK